MRVLGSTIDGQKNATENRLIYLLDVAIGDLNVRVSDVEITYGGNIYLPLIASLNNLNEELNEEAYSNSSINITIFNKQDYEVTVEGLTFTHKLSDVFLNHSEGAVCNLYAAFCTIGTKTILGSPLLILTGFVESPVQINDDTINFSIIDKSFKYNKNFGIVITSDFTSFVPEKSLGLVIPRVYGTCDNVNLIPIRDGKTVVLKTSILQGNSITEIETEEILSSWSSTGTIVIDIEEFAYTGKSDNKFTFTSAKTVGETHLRGTQIVEKLMTYKYAIADSMGITVVNGFDANFSATGVKSTTEFRIKTRDNGFISVTPDSTQDELIANKYKIRTAVFNTKPKYKEYSKSPTLLELKEDSLSTDDSLCEYADKAIDNYDVFTWATLKPILDFNMIGVKIIRNLGASGEKAIDTMGEITNADVSIKYLSEKMLTMGSQLKAEFFWKDENGINRIANLGYLPKPTELNILSAIPDFTNNHGDGTGQGAHRFTQSGAQAYNVKPNRHMGTYWDFNSETGAGSWQNSETLYLTNMQLAYDANEVDTYGILQQNPYSKDYLHKFTPNRDAFANIVKFYFDGMGGNEIKYDMTLRFKLRGSNTYIQFTINPPYYEKEVQALVKFYKGTASGGKTLVYSKVIDCFSPYFKIISFGANLTLNELKYGHFEITPITWHDNDTRSVPPYTSWQFDTIEISDVNVNYVSQGDEFLADELYFLSEEMKIALQSAIITYTIDLTNISDVSDPTKKFDYANWELWKDAYIKITYLYSTSETEAEKEGTWHREADESLSEIYVANVQFYIEYSSFQWQIASDMVCKIEGMKAYGTTDLLRHPAKIIKDLLLYNGVLSSEIDSTSYTAILSYINVGLDMALLEMQELYEIIKQIDYHSKFKTAWLVDRFKFLPNKEYDASPTIDKEIDIQTIGIGSIQIKKDNFTEIKNRFFVYYKRDFSEDDSEENYHGVLESKNQDSINKVGERSEKIFLPFIKTQTDAQTIADYLKNLYASSIVSTTVKTPLTTLELEKGDIIRVNYYIDALNIAKYMGYKLTGKILNVNRLLQEYNQIEYAVKIINIESRMQTDYCFYYDVANYIYFVINYNSASGKYECHKYFVIGGVKVAEIYVPDIITGRFGNHELRLKGVLYENCNIRSEGGDDPMGFQPSQTEPPNSARFYWVNHNGERIAEITAYGNLRIANIMQSNKYVMLPVAFTQTDHPCFFNYHDVTFDDWYNVWMVEVRAMPLLMIPTIYFDTTNYNDKMVLKYGKLKENFTF